MEFGWRDNAYASLFYTIVGLHALHVFVGSLMSLTVQTKAWLGKVTAERHVTPEVFALYWHFVDGVWIFVFASLCLVAAHIVDDNACALRAVPRPRRPLVWFALIAGSRPGSCTSRRSPRRRLVHTRHFWLFYVGNGVALVLHARRRVAMSLAHGPRHRRERIPTRRPGASASSATGLLVNAINLAAHPRSRAATSLHPTGG